MDPASRQHGGHEARAERGTCAPVHALTPAHNPDDRYTCTSCRHTPHSSRPVCLQFANGIVVLLGRWFYSGVSVPWTPLTPRWLPWAMPWLDCPCQSCTARRHKGSPPLERWLQQRQQRPPLQCRCGACLFAVAGSIERKPPLNQCCYYLSLRKWVLNAVLWRMLYP